MRSTLKPGVVFSAIGIALGFFYAKSRLVDPTEHARLTRDFQVARSLETTLNQDILQSRYGIHQNYDALVEDIRQLRTARSRIERLPSFVGEDARRAYAQKVEAYSHLVGVREELTERFKVANALVKNSENYFPVLMEKLIDSLRHQGDRRPQVDRLRDLLDVVLKYDIAPSAESHREVLAKTEALRALPEEAWLPAQRDLLDLAIAHAMTIIENKALLDEIIQEAIARSASGVVDELREIYLAEYERAARTASRYRLLMYLFGLMTLAAIAYFFLRLRATTIDLNHAKEHLEQRVQMRTRELLLKSQEVAASEARVKAILQGSLDAILSLDDHGRILSFNAAAAGILGSSSQAHLASQAAPLLFCGSDAERFQERIDACREQGRRTGIGEHEEMTCRRADGGAFPAEVSLTTASADSQTIFVCNIRDITERKRVQQLKDEFISTVSHELRTPLTSIRGSLGLVLGGAAGAIPEEARELAEIAGRNTDRLSRLINDILDLEKIESGRMEFDIRPISLRQALEDAVEANRSFAEQFGVRYVLSEPLPTVDVLADGDRLMQVLTNLLSNAAKFSPSGAEVSLEAVCRGARARIAVRDRGPGIPEDFRDRLFEKFTQAGEVSTRRVGGTGLGLSICKAIMEEMGGSIGFETEVGRGSTFFVELPIRPVPLEEAALERPQDRVLICEEDPDLGRLLALGLREHGYASDLARSAGEAKQRLSKHRYHAMTLGLGLPDQDGIALLRELRANPETASLPIFFVSGSVDRRRERFHAGAVQIVDWVQKPIEDRRLLDALSLALRRMKRAHLRILHVEGEIRRVVARLVGDRAEIVEVATLHAALEKLGSEEFHLVVLDLGLPDGSGLAVLTEIDPRVPVILFAAEEPDAALNEAVEAMLVKFEMTPDELLETVVALLDEARPRD